MAGNVVRELEMRLEELKAENARLVARLEELEMELESEQAKHRGAREVFVKLICEAYGSQREPADDAAPACQVETDHLKPRGNVIPFRALGTKSAKSANPRKP